MDPLSTTTIGTTSVRVTRLGLGTAPLGGWPAAVPEAEGLATIEAAWDLGLRYFDTAPFYGYGQSETWIGRVLRTKPRDEFTLSTKVGRLIRDVETDEERIYHGVPPLSAVFDFSREGVRRSLEESLERTGLDRVDIALIHDPDDHLDEALDGAYVALDELRSEGVVGAIGAGMNWAEPLVYLSSRADLDCVLLAGRYTLLEQPGLEELLPLAVEKGMSIVVGGAFNSGILVDPSPGAHYNYAAAHPDLIERAGRLADVCSRHGVPLPAAALQFPYAHPAVATIVSGARTPGEIRQNADYLRLPIPPELWDDLRAEDLLGPDVPTPSAT